MIHRPEILFLDEPTTGVDPVSRKEFWEMLKKLNEGGLTILVSTPYMDEASQCHRIALIQKGNIMAVDTPEGMVQQFSRQLYSVQGQNNHRLILTLKQFPSAHTVFSFGSEIHYTDQHADFNPKELIEYLKSHNHQDFRIDKAKAGIEDVFMELMPAHE